MARKILIVCGTTATGKTDYVLKIAETFQAATIISVDSRQVYTGLGLVTGQNIPDGFMRLVSTSVQYASITPGIYYQRGHIKIWGQDFLSPSSSLNISDYVQFVWSIISETDPNEPVLLVGGTGLYLKAIANPMLDIHVPLDFELRDSLRLHSLIELQRELKSVDPVRFRKLNQSDSNNPRRIVRQLELSRGGESIVPKFDYRRLQEKSKFLWLGLRTDPSRLQSRIRNRVISRVESGAPTEVAHLVDSFPNTELPIFTSLGVVECLAYLSGRITKDQLIATWTAAELAYAKRQTTWFKKQPGIIWYDKIAGTDITNTIKQWQKS